MNQHTKQTGKQTNTHTQTQHTQTNRQHTQTHSAQITHSRCWHCHCRCCCCRCCCCIDANNWRNELLLPIFNNRFRGYLSWGVVQVLPGVKWLIINAQLCICNAKVATGATNSAAKALDAAYAQHLQGNLSKYRQMQSGLIAVYKLVDSFIYQNIKISHFNHLDLRQYSYSSLIMQELQPFSCAFN